MDEKRINNHRGGNDDPSDEATSLITHFTALEYANNHVCLQ